jgi:hypothetical protein
MMDSEENDNVASIPFLESSMNLLARYWRATNLQEREKISRWEKSFKRPRR